MKTIICSQCDFENLATDNFCRSCGVQLESDRPDTLQRNQTIAAIICPQCDFENLATDNYCRGCGVQLESYRPDNLTPLPLTHSLDEPVRPTPPNKPPWNPKEFFLLSIFFSFASVGILAGLNWRRLGQPERMWSTILFSIGGLVLYLALFLFLPIPEQLGTILGYGINIGIGALIGNWQKTAFDSWTAVYGVPTTKQSGCLIPLAIGFIIVPIISVAVYAAFAFGTTAPATTDFEQGNAYFEQGAFTQAINAYTKAADTAPDAPTYYHRGLSYENLENYWSAIEDYDKAIEFDPQFLPAHRSRAGAYLQLGQLNVALRGINEAIMIDDDDGLCYFLRAAIYVDMDQKALARIDLYHALELDLEPEVEEVAREFLAELEAE